MRGLVQRRQRTDPARPQHAEAPFFQAAVHPSLVWNSAKTALCAVDDAGHLSDEAVSQSQTRAAGIMAAVLARLGFGLIFAICSFLNASDQMSLTASPCSRIYSGVRLVPEVDDYVGSEIVIWRCTAANVAAEWRLYEGGHEPSRTQLEGTLVGGQIVLRGTLSDGETVNLRASIGRRSLIGSATIADRSLVPLKLRRTTVTWPERLARADGHRVPAKVR